VNEERYILEVDQSSIEGANDPISLAALKGSSALTWKVPGTKLGVREMPSESRTVTGPQSFPFLCKQHLKG